MRDTPRIPGKGYKRKIALLEAETATLRAQLAEVERELAAAEFDKNLYHNQLLYFNTHADAAEATNNNVTTEGRQMSQQVPEELTGLLGVIKAKWETSNVKRLPCDILKFEDEDAAVAHAQRLIALQPGAEIFVKLEGARPTRAVFCSPAKDGRMAVVMEWDKEDGTLGLAETPYGSIRFAVG